MYMEFFPGQKHGNQHSDISESLDAFQDAGYVLKDSDLVVDIDDLGLEKTRALVKAFGVRTETVWTERGAHLYFKKPEGFTRKQGICPLGFKVEYIHTGYKDAVTVKRNGVARKVDNPGKREPLPGWLYLPGKKFYSLQGLQEGDGRNNALYKHKAKICTLDEWRLMLKFINENVFAEPLPDKELETICRAESMPTGGDAESAIAYMIMREHKTVVYNNAVWFEDMGVYNCNDHMLNRLVYQYCQGEKTKFVDEVKRQLLYLSELIPETEVFPIKLKNGFLYNGEFIEADYTRFTPYYIPLEYKKDAKPVAIVDDYIDQLTGGDPKYRDMLLEVMGHTLITSPFFKRQLAKFFIFIGNGGEGKGTFLEVLRTILGFNNCSSLSIDQLADERYFCNVSGKLANLGDDVEDRPINGKKEKILKNVTTADAVELRRMRENSFSAILTASLIFTSNHIIKSFEKSEAFKRRVVWMPMFSKPKVKDPLFIKKITTPEALEYWLCLMVEAYQRLYRNGEFTDCRVVKSYTQQYHLENNNTEIFISGLEKSDILHQKPKDIYEQYEIWCEDNGEDPLAKKRLKEAICRTFGMKTSTIRKEITKGGKKGSPIFVYVEDKGLKK